MTYLAHISKNILFVLSCIMIFSFTSNGADPYIDFYVVKNTQLVGQINGQPLTAALPFPGPQNSNSTISTAPMGGMTEFVYDPEEDFLGVDVFSFDLSNSTNGLSFTSEVRIFVVESIVKAEHDYYGAESGQSITFDVLSNDYASRSVKTLSNISISTGVTSATIVGDQINITTANGFSGVCHISYTVCDDLGACDVAELNINVLNVNIQSDTVKIFTNRRTEIEFPFNLENMADNMPTAQKGSFSILDDNAIYYMPNYYAIGSEFLTFNLASSNGILSRTAEIVILPKESNKLAFDDVAYTFEGEYVDIDVKDNDFGSTSISENYTLNKNIPNATITWLGNGVFRVTPNADFLGVISFPYKTVSSGQYEFANVNVYVTDFSPELSKYHLTTPLGIPIVVDYDVPYNDFVFNIDDNETTNDGFIEFHEGYYEIPGTDINGYDLLIYTPGEIGLDGVEVEYCLFDGSSDCMTIEIEIDVIDVITPIGFCAGTDCVWPGDANNDGHVNMDDILSVGLCMGEMGSERSNQSENWMPYSGDNWDIPEISSMPLKHMDCDGDGAISYNDAMIVEDAYNKYHTLNPEIAALNKQSVDFDDIILEDYLGPNGEEWTQVYVALKLGSASKTVYDANGISFKFVFDTAVVNESLAVTFYDDTWFTINNTPLTSVINPNVNEDAPQIDAAISRTNMQSVSGYGIIGQLGFIIREDIEGIKSSESYINYYFDAHVAIAYDDLVIEHEQVQNVNIQIPFIGEEETVTADLHVYPNPVGDWLNVKLFSSEPIETIELFSLTGQRMDYFELGSQNVTQLDMSKYTSGLYFIKVQTESTMVTKKVEVIR